MSEILLLGGKKQLKDAEIKTATINARRIFLKLIWEMKPEISSDLMRICDYEQLPEDFSIQNFLAKFFIYHSQKEILYSINLKEIGFHNSIRNVPILAYFDFIHKSRNELEQFLEISKEDFTGFSPLSDKLVKRKALDYLIPNWSSLKSHTNAEWLCSVLEQWAEKWNLKSDWCLDFALDCLKNFHTEFIDSLYFEENFISENDTFAFWELRSYSFNGKSWNNVLYDAIWEASEDYFVPISIENYPSFKFVCYGKARKELFRIEDSYNPLTKFDFDFTRKVKKEFWQKILQISLCNIDLLLERDDFIQSQYKKLKKNLTEFIKNAESKLADRTENTPVKKSGDLHFRWLIEFQFDPKTTFSSIARKSNCDNKTVRDGIKDISALIGLKLRQSVIKGRTKGIKETHKRHIAKS